MTDQAQPEASDSSDTASMQRGSGSSRMAAIGRSALTWLVVLVASATSHADSAFVFIERDQFVAATGATKVTAPYTESSAPFPTTQVSGDIKFQAVAPSSLNFGPWPADFADDNDIELTLNDNENLYITHLAGPVHALGFEFAFDNTFTNRSIFAVTALNGGAEVARFVFDTPKRPNERFVGLWSSAPFDTFRIQEMPTEPPRGDANDHFGAVYAGTQPPSSGRKKLTADDPALGDYFGRSVSISGDLALIGAYGADHDLSLVGSAYVFARQPNGQWLQSAKLTADDGGGHDQFGFSVSLSGDRALVGAFGDDNYGDGAGGIDSGSAYVFERQPDGQWLQSAKLTADGATAFERFGHSVSLSGDRALIGGGFESRSAYVFARQPDGQWLQSAKLTADDPVRGGSSVSLSGDLALIGAPRDDHAGGSSGSAYVFALEPDGQWRQVAKLTADDSAMLDLFGSSVSLSDDLALIGAIGDEDGGRSAGSAYVFARQPDGQWLQAAKLTADDASEDDRFGVSVSISDDRALVGAGFDDSGSAYVFVRQPNSQWSQSAKLTANDAAEFDQFGISVSLSGERALIGSSADDDGRVGSGSAHLIEFVLFKDDFETMDNEP